MTNGGDKDVTTRKTERALVDKPDTTISPPGLRRRWNKHRIRNDMEKEEIYETSRTLNVYFITLTKQSCLNELFDPTPIQHVSTLCFQDLEASLSVTFSSRLVAFEAAAVAVVNRACCKMELNLTFRSLI